MIYDIVRLEPKSATLYYTSSDTKKLRSFLDYIRTAACFGELWIIERDTGRAYKLDAVIDRILRDGEP